MLSDMKKILALLLSVFFILFSSACGEEKLFSADGVGKIILRNTANDPDGRKEIEDPKEIKKIIGMLNSIEYEKLNDEIPKGWIFSIRLEDESGQFLDSVMFLGENMIADGTYKIDSSVQEEFLEYYDSLELEELPCFE